MNVKVFEITTTSPSYPAGEAGVRGAAIYRPLSGCTVPCGTIGYKRGLKKGKEEGTGAVRPAASVSSSGGGSLGGIK